MPRPEAEGSGDHELGREQKGRTGDRRVATPPLAEVVIERAVLVATELEDGDARYAVDAQAEEAAPQRLDSRALAGGVAVLIERLFPRLLLVRVHHAQVTEDGALVDGRD